MIELLTGPRTLKGGSNGVGIKLVRRPGSQDRGALSIDHQEVGGDPTGLDLPLDREVGKREVGGDQEGGVRIRVPDRVETWLDLDGFLGICIDILSGGQKREEILGLVEINHHHSRILSNQERRLQHLGKGVSREVALDQRGVAQGAELPLQSLPPDRG